MPSRHEEKYIITYRQYLMLKERAMQVLTPDPNGQDGSYLINSLYFDDRLDHALDEKLDGLPDHSKFRIRAYDLSPELIKLEKKDNYSAATSKWYIRKSTVDDGQLSIVNAANTART